MTTYIAGNSITHWKATKHSRNYIEILGAEKLTGGGHGWLYTVLGAIYQTTDLELKDNDIMIFHFGINDCIYRKNAIRQFPLFYKVWCNTEIGWMKDFIQKRIVLLINKNPDGLMQFLTFDEFRKNLEYLGNRMKENRAIKVFVGINKFSSSNKKIGYATEQAYQTNEILRKFCLEYDFHFIDLWKCPVETICDGVHLTPRGHSSVASRIGGLI